MTYPELSVGDVECMTGRGEPLLLLVRGLDRARRDPAMARAQPRGISTRRLSVPFPRACAKGDSLISEHKA